MITLFVGGHISALPREVLETEPSIDYICQNEGVYTISNLLSAMHAGTFDKSKIKGLGYRNESGKAVLNPTEKIVPKNLLSADLPWNGVGFIARY